MAEKPILFSTEMVRATLDGRKTQTRRVIKPQPGEHPDDDGYVTSILNRCPYDVENTLWVRETWAIEDTYIIYRADLDNWSHLKNVKWRPSIHMPREAARLFLLVKDVRVERLQDITEEDARAEGFSPNDIITANLDLGTPVMSCEYTGPAETARNSFRVTWDKLNAKYGYGWDANPWEWVISFERIEKNETRDKWH